MPKLMLSAGAFYALFAVILGAFGAHALKGKLTAEQLNSFSTATDYQFMHALALLAVAIIAQVWAAQSIESRLLSYSGYAFIAGTLLFSGSIYLLVLTGIRHIGPINIALVTPLGGSILIIGWALLLAAALKH